MKRNRNNMQIEDNNSAMRSAKRPVRRSSRIAAIKPTDRRETFMYTFNNARDPTPLLGHITSIAFADKSDLFLNLVNQKNKSKIDSAEAFMNAFLNTVTMNVGVFMRDSMTGIFNEKVAVCDVTDGRTLLDSSDVRFPLAATEFEIELSSKVDTRKYRYRLLNYQVIQGANDCFTLIEILKTCMGQTTPLMRFIFFWYIVRTFFGGYSANVELLKLLKDIRFASIHRFATTMNNNAGNAGKHVDLAKRLFDALANDEKAIDVTKTVNGDVVPAIMEGQSRANNANNNNAQVLNNIIDFSNNGANDLDAIQRLPDDPWWHNYRNTTSGTKQTSKPNKMFAEYIQSLQDPVASVANDMSRMSLTNARPNIQKPPKGVSQADFNNVLRRMETMKVGGNHINDFYLNVGAMTPDTFGVHYRIVADNSRKSNIQRSNNAMKARG